MAIVTDKEKMIEAYPDLVDMLNRLLSAIDDVELSDDAKEAIVPIVAEADGLLAQIGE